MNISEDVYIYLNETGSTRHVAEDRWTPALLAVEEHMRLRSFLAYNRVYIHIFTYTYIYLHKSIRTFN